MHPCITATNHLDEQSSALCIIRAQSRHGGIRPKHLKSSHIVGYKFTSNHSSQLYDRWHQHNKKEGQQNCGYTCFRALWLSYSLSPNKKLGEKIKSTLNTIVLLGGGDTRHSHFNVLRQLPVAKRSSEEPP